jgi:hypothetical protein
VRNLRLPGVLIVLGYLGIAAGTVGWLVAATGRTPWEFYVSDLAPLIGYGLAGFACWRWIVRSQTTNANPLQSTPSRWMAAASVVTAAGWVAITYFYYENHQSFYRQRIPAATIAMVDPHYRLRMAGYSSILVGLLLAGAGFWIASSGTSSESQPNEAAVSVP